MLNTIAYYLGYTGNEVAEAEPSSENDNAPTFVTKETDEQWTWVDVSSTKSEGNCEVNNEYPTPPPTPKLEQSWLITPPPCFNAENARPVEEPLSPRENLLIEHPSMFVRPSISDEEEKQVEEPEQEKAVVASPPHKKATAQSRSKRRAARQALVAISQQSKRNYQFKKTSSNVIHRSNKAMKKMRQPVHQPRKNY